MRISHVAPALLAAFTNARFVMYADEWHPTRPKNPADRAGIDHIVLAFAMANAKASFQPKVPISTIRSEFPDTQVMIAVGGWGDDIGFFQLSKSDASIMQFAADIATMLTNTGADGVDIDWEYPGGNGGDYKQVENSEKAYQIDDFPKVLAEIRAAIGNKLLSIAVPGKEGDMIAYTKETGPNIWPSVDYINATYYKFMSYDLINRRDNVTKHHSSAADSAQVIENYLAIAAPAEKINLGFTYYAKYFTTKGDCSNQPLGCPQSLQKTHPEKLTKCSSGCCSQYGNCGTSPQHCSDACQPAFGTGCTDPDVFGSWQLALASGGVTDEEAGAQYFFDKQNGLWWTWDTEKLIERKFEQVVKKYGLGGVVAWSLDEDSNDGGRVRRMAAELAKGKGKGKGGNKTPGRPKPDRVKSGLAKPIKPSASKAPYDKVWVDGTPKGLGSEDVSTPGVPEDYVFPAKEVEVEASTPQGKEPIVPVGPVAPIEIVAPVAPVQPAPATTTGGLPFSPEYLALMNSMGRRRKGKKILPTGLVVRG